MIRKLDKLVLKAFFPPFLLTFFVVIFILLSQFMIKYFDDFVGKDLGLSVYLELLYFFTLNMVPMALPISILLSSLMSYGNLGEFNELTAIKSSGISLLRIIAPTFVVILLLAIGAFFFNNDVVPYANLRAYSLLYDIRTKKAALNIKEGTFYYGLPGYVIKINKKNPDGTVEDIMIYDHQENRGNVNVTLAKSGKMYTILGGRYLVLELFDGANYSETNQRSQKPNEFTHNTFKQSKIIFSLSSFDFSRTDVELFASNKLMRNISQLQADKDSLKRETVKIQENLLGNIKSYYSFLYRPHYNRISHNSKIDALIDSLWAQDNSTLASAISIAASNLNNLKNYTNSYNERLLNLRKEYHVFDVEVHRKFTQSIACIVLFLIGAPLGAIIKKGGIGLPVIISIIFFIIYYILSTTGEKWTKEEIVDIYVGMWYGIFVLLIAGLYFLNHARNDSSLFEKGYLSGLFAKLRGKLSKSPTTAFTVSSSK